MNRPSVFLGSSKEGEAVGEIIIGELKDMADCVLWSKDFFKLNVSSFDNLCKEAISFDFAVLVATKDDKSIIRKKKHLVIRDNVVFEYGLFSGAIGRQKTFIVVQEGTKIPSDWSGISLLFFKTEQDLLEVCEKLRKKIAEEHELSRISLLPSTASAIGYHTNFITPLCEALQREKQIEINHEIRPFVPDRNKIEIVIPGELHKDMKISAENLQSQHQLIPVSLPAIHGPLRAYVKYQEKEENYRIIDFPTCLNTSKIAIDLYLGKDFIGKPEALKKYESKEILNFFRTLNNLKNENAYQKKVIRIVREDEII